MLLSTRALAAKSPCAVISCIHCSSTKALTPSSPSLLSAASTFPRTRRNPSPHLTMDFTCSQISLHLHLTHTCATGAPRTACPCPSSIDAPASLLRARTRHRCSKHSSRRLPTGSQFSSASHSIYSGTRKPHIHVHIDAHHCCYRIHCHLHFAESFNSHSCFTTRPHKTTAPGIEGGSGRRRRGRGRRGEGRRRRGKGGGGEGGEGREGKGPGGSPARRHTTRQHALLLTDSFRTLSHAQVLHVAEVYRLSRVEAASFTGIPDHRSIPTALALPQTHSFLQAQRHLSVQTRPSV